MDSVIDYLFDPERFSTDEEKQTIKEATKIADRALKELEEGRSDKQNRSFSS